MLLVITGLGSRRSVDEFIAIYLNRLKQPPYILITPQLIVYYLIKFFVFLSIGKKLLKRLR